MSNLETNLYRASSICEGNFTYLKDYSKTYTFTTENINGYIKYFDLKRKRLLTVGSSGDQVLNAFFYGARDITLYDINPYAKYYVYLKIATILSIEYMEFQEFFFKREIHNLKDYYNRKMFCKDLYDKIKYNLRSFDYESFLYFDELFHSFEPTTIREYLFDDDECRNKVIKNFNVYLTNEISYNKLKKTIKNINFKYICGNIFEDKIPGKFDNIILSNLCTITNLKTFKRKREYFIRIFMGYRFLFKRLL